MRGDLVAPAAIIGGVARWTVPIPADAALLGGVFHLQALLESPTANPAGVLLSAGATGTIGGR